MRGELYYDMCGSVRSDKQKTYHNEKIVVGFRQRLLVRSWLESNNRLEQHDSKYKVHVIG